MIGVKYLGTVFTYGFVRKLVYTNNLEYKEVRYEGCKKIVNKTPILYIDRLMFAILAGYRSILTHPFEIIRDIRYLEKKYRNIKDINDDVDINITYNSVMFSID